MELFLVQVELKSVLVVSLVRNIQLSPQDLFKAAKAMNMTLGDFVKSYCERYLGADKLAKQGRSRTDCKSLSRVAQLIPANKGDFLFIADSDPGETDSKGLIVPKFGNKPENHVAVNMSFESLSELFLMTKMHYQMWLASWYVQNPIRSAQRQQTQYQTNHIEQSDNSVPMF